jgi:hypothetical protein
LMYPSEKRSKRGCFMENRTSLPVIFKY